MSQNLKATLMSLVEMSRTSDRAADYLYTILAETTDRNDRQQVELAIRFALKNAKAL